MSQELIPERPTSSVSQCLSTTTIEEKPEPFLSVSVTIRPGTDAVHTEDAGCGMNGEKDDIELEKREENAIMHERSCQEKEDVIDEDVKKDEDVQREKGTSELLPGWKGYSSNIYIQPIIVKTSKEEKHIQKKNSNRLSRHFSIHEIRRQMQLRQASEWITKHNQRIYLKGSLKVGEIPNRLRRTPYESGRSSQSSQTSTKSSTQSTSPRISPNDHRLPKTRLAKGFACRSWSREHLPVSPRSQTGLRDALSVRSYVNLGDPFWRDNRSKTPHCRDKKSTLTNKTPRVDFKQDDKISNDLNVNKYDEEKYEKADDKVDHESVVESTLSSEESTISDSVNLADVLFKSVSLNAKSNSCKNCTANFPVVDTKFSAKPESEKRPSPLGAGSSFPPLVNGSEKHCGSDDSTRVHRPKTVNLTFSNGVSFSAVTKGGGMRRTRSSVKSTSF